MLSLRIQKKKKKVVYIVLDFIIIPQYLNGVNRFFAKNEEKSKFRKFSEYISANYETNDVQYLIISVKIIIRK